MSDSRKHFILSKGATCNNWNWSWSFINVDKKQVIFGAWDYNTDNEKSLIMHEDWERKNDRLQPGYSQAKDHLKLLDKGFDLYIFHQENIGDSEDDPKIGKISDNLYKAYIKRDGKAWYAYKNAFDYMPDETDSEIEYFEGTRKLVAVNAYERNKDAREQCIKEHGAICKACGFDFESTYGEHGKGFIHVHHKISLKMIGKRYKVDPENDLIPLCPNCHAMIHRYKDKELEVDQLKELLALCKK